MPKIKLSINHKLGKQVAIERVKSLTKDGGNSLSNEISSLKSVWKNDFTEFSCVVRGIKIDGSLQFSDNSVTISGGIPFILFPLKGQIEKVVRQYAGNILA